MSTATMFPEPGASASDSHSRFMNSTGFGAGPNVPSVSPKSTAVPQRRDFQATPSDAMAAHTGQQPGLAAFHAQSGADTQASRIPGTLASAPAYPNSLVTPNQGLVPGHAPQSPTAKTPFPESDRLDKPPFQYGGSKKKQDWRAVGVGPKTDRRSPGQVATAAETTMTRFKKLKNKVVEKMGGSKFQSMSTGGKATSIGVMTALAAAFGFWVFPMGFGGFVMLASSLFIGFFAALVYYLGWGKEEKALGRAAIGEGGPIQDVSREQKYQPLFRHQGEHVPYPKIDDRPASFQERMKDQGTDVGNLEGPRSHFRYKRGPTPGNQKRLENTELMRSAEMNNMDEYEFGEYMARLDGEAPDQFYQAHSYHPFAAHWDERQQINDMDTVFGISTSPGQMNRKYTYIDPRIQQGGAKTMHLKEPPPGSNQPLDKVHPWLRQREEAATASPPMDMDKYMMQQQQTQQQTQMPQMPQQQAPGRHPRQKMMQPLIQDDMNSKVDSHTVDQLARQRMNETEMFAHTHPPSPPGTDNGSLPPGLQPIPTSREGMTKIHEERMQKFAQTQNRAGMPPPHPRQPHAPYPQLYDKQAPLYERSAARQPVAPEDKAESEFSSAFTTSKGVDQKTIDAAMQDTRR